MKLFSTEHIFKYNEVNKLSLFFKNFLSHPWETVSIANWIKYPNQMAPHVTNVDYLSRRIDPLTGNLYTERLLSCKQNAPEFLIKMVGGQNSSIVYERSVVDLKGRRLVLKSSNLTFAHLLTVEETCTYEAVEYGDAASEDHTRFTQTASIRSFSAWNYLRDTLEDFSISRFQVNAQKGRAALENVLQGLFDDTRTLFREKFGEFGDDLEQFIKCREDPQVQKEATQMAQEGIVEQE